MRIILNESGLGSKEKLLEYVEGVIRENCTIKPDRMITAVSEDKETRLARCIVHSVLVQLGIER